MKTFATTLLSALIITSTASAGQYIPAGGKFSVAPGERVVIYGAKNGCSDEPLSPADTKIKIEVRPEFNPPVGARLTYQVVPGDFRESRSCGGQVAVTRIILEAGPDFQSYTFRYYGDTAVVTRK